MKDTIFNGSAVGTEVNDKSRDTLSKDERNGRGEEKKEG